MPIQKGDPNWPTELDLTECAGVNQCMEAYGKTRKQILVYLVWRGIGADKEKPYEK